MSADRDVATNDAGTVSIEVAAGIADAPLIAERRWLLFTEAERILIADALAWSVRSAGTRHDEYRELERQIRATLELEQ